MGPSIRERISSYALALWLTAPAVALLAFGLWTEDDGRRDLARVGVGALATTAVAALGTAYALRRGEDRQLRETAAQIDRGLLDLRNATSRLQSVQRQRAELSQMEQMEDFGLHLAALESARMGDVRRERDLLRGVIDRALQSATRDVRRAAQRLRAALESSERNGGVVDPHIVEEWAAAVADRRRLHSSGSQT